MASENTASKNGWGVVTRELIHVKHDGALAISIGGSRFEKKWENAEWQWSQLVEKLSESIPTKETRAEFAKWDKTKEGKEKQDKAKDVGGFVGGYVPNGRRLKGAVKERQIITLDADHMAAGESLDDKMLETDKLNVGFVVYSTHKHSAEAPRQRLVIPMTRIVSAEEYEAISRKIAEMIGIDLFDDTTYEAHRLMYWPSHSRDAEPYFYFFDAELLDPDVILAEYPDWRDTNSWPHSSRVEDIRKRQAKEAGNPLEKDGVIGAFCRTYTIPEAIDKFLSDVYEPTDRPDRYTYKPGSASGGLVIYGTATNDDVFAYSHHSTDPAGGQLCNAFDLVRIHMFGHKDEEEGKEKQLDRRPSQKAMIELARKDSGVNKLLLEEAQADFEEGEEDGMQLDRLPKSGNPAPTLINCMRIFNHDEDLSCFAYNELTHMTDITAEAPWKRSDGASWTESDYGCVRVYIAKRHKVEFKKADIKDAVNTARMERKYHPIKKMFDELPEWDGVKRAETLLIDYLGAEDDDKGYTRAVTLKTLKAARYRIYHPGCKFDYMLVLTGTQGMGKSTLFRKVSLDWFTDSLHMSDMGDTKKAAEVIEGKWFVEVAELSGMSNAESDDVKSFLSSQSDVYRGAYEANASDHPRACVLIGTTNKKVFLKDPTGNRRYWVVPCSEDNRKMTPWDLDDDTVKQIWAEVKAGAENDREKDLCLPRELEDAAKERQTGAMNVDEDTEKVKEYLDVLLPEDWEKTDQDLRNDFFREKGSQGVIQRDAVTIKAIAFECLHYTEGDWKRNGGPCSQKAIIKRVQEIMEQIPGWERVDGSTRVPGYDKTRSAYRRKKE